MNGSCEERAFTEKLCSVKGLNGSVGLSLIDYFGSAEEVFKADDKTLAKLLPPALSTHLQKTKNAESATYPEHTGDDKNRINFITIHDPGYPKKLLDIPDAPLGLWYIGELPKAELPSVAVIGARECSQYGEHIAKDLGKSLAKAGVQVISGMARGIDGISQQAAADEGGRSFGVLGSGVDICYPPSNRKLYDSLKICGGIISIYPPGEPAIAHNFPPRNRRVSGLSDAVIVIEARQKSGTLITVDMALEQGREVYAVPGRITDRLSDGCNGLIGQGASVFLSPDIFLAELSELIASQKNGSPAPERETRIKRASLSKRITDLHRKYQGGSDLPPGLDEEAAKVLSRLDLSPKSAQDIIDKLDGYDYPSVSMILMQLIIDGYAEQVGQGNFVRKY